MPLLEMWIARLGLELVPSLFRCQHGGTAIVTQTQIPILLALPVTGFRPTILAHH
jgi:hypothetical protein